MTKDQDPSAEPLVPVGQDEGAEEAPNGAGEAETAGGEEAAGTLSREELLTALEEARSRADTHHDELLRARAEIANLHRRAERDIENAHKYGIEKFVGELLPVIDSLELGLQAASSAGAGEEVDKLREGTELTLRMLLTAVGKFGVRPVDPQGERFDPALHQAMSMQPAPPGGEQNRVLTVYQKGYLLNDRLVRPAMVVVSGPPATEPDGEGGPPGGKIDEMA